MSSDPLERGEAPQRMIGDPLEQLMEAVPTEQELDLGEIGGADFFLPSARGRRASFTADFVRELTADDLPAILGGGPAAPNSVPALQRIRYQHHQIARLVVEGRKGEEISAITGFSPSWISTLKHDPAFRELLAYYEAQKEAVFVDVHQRLATLGLATVEELQERLASDPDSFSNKALMELAELVLDRSVAPPKNGQKGGGGAAGHSGVAINISFVSPPEGVGQIIDAEVIEP